ncbi:hypothetical protein [Alkalinema sp. FACHB-956]|nr:hypothetical protein [Alkalinema sp. FACHB-956]MBD2327878.1 hypothetical protein [Alkalinema sp. FACHB-956]
MFDWASRSGVFDRAIRLCCVRSGDSIGGWLGVFGVEFEGVCLVLGGVA